ncbi:hypothetical protein D3C85_830600 [compost metagenome]
MFGERPANTRMAVQFMAALNNRTTLPSMIGTTSKPLPRRLISTTPSAASSIVQPKYASGRSRVSRNQACTVNSPIRAKTKTETTSRVGMCSTMSLVPIERRSEASPYGKQLEHKRLCCKGGVK